MVENNDEASSSEETLHDSLVDVGNVGRLGVGDLDHGLLILGTRRS